MNIVVSKLNENGYTTVPYNENNNITGITLTQNGENIDNIINLNIETDETLSTQKVVANFTLEPSNEKLEYLVTINNQQHIMICENRIITVFDEIFNGSTNIYPKIKVTPNNVNGILIKIGDELLSESKEIDAGTEISIEATSDVTEDASLILSYAEFEKEYSISVNKKITLKAGNCMIYPYIDPNGNTKNEKFIVLYDDEYNKINNVDYGIQIISDTSLEVVTIGYMKEYNWYNMESALNGLAEKYINGSSIALSSRCVGSLPTDSYNDFTPSNNNDNYLIDINQLNNINAAACSSGGNWDGLDIGSQLNGSYFLASKYYVSSNQGEYVRWYYRNNGVQSSWVYFWQAMGNSSNITTGYRPVIKINNSEFYAKGDGTRDKPYILTALKTN